MSDKQRHRGLTAVYRLLSVILVVAALWVLGRIVLHFERQYDETHSYCEECMRELNTSDLAPVNNGNGYVCAQCIHEYFRCSGCDGYWHNDYIVNNSYCENCAEDFVGFTSYDTPIVNIDTENISWQPTPESDCFSEVAFDENTETLYVRFRSSGSAYMYLKFSRNDWETFISQDSLGTWYNESIKGQYACRKIEE